MSPAECEVVADVGVRLRIIAEGLYAGAQTLTTEDVRGRYLHRTAEHLDEVLSRLGRLPMCESEGEASVTEDLTTEVLAAIDARLEGVNVERLTEGSLERLLSLVYLDGRKAGLEAAQAVYSTL